MRATVKPKSTVDSSPSGIVDEQVKYLLSISRELNGERDITRLLTMILTRSREVTCADAGSIYVVDCPTGNYHEGFIHFKVTQNHSVPQSLAETTLPIDDTTLVGRAVISGEVINTPDVYQMKATLGPGGRPRRASVDEKTGYETHSVLTVPMFDISHRVIGVIQLINRKRHPERQLIESRHFAEEVIPFEERDEEYASIVAQQAGIALENALLTQEVQSVLEGFVHASVTAIEQRDPTTSGHSHRVAALTCELARHVDHVSSGPYAGTHFTADQLKEIEYASLLHDFGKLGVRESVLVKAKKLYPWQRELLTERFEQARASYEIEYLRECLRVQRERPGADLTALTRARDERLAELERLFEAILKANEPTVLEQGGFEILQALGTKQYRDHRGRERALLHPDELSALCVPKGSLTPQEFGEIQTHVVHTYNFLRKIPWGRAIANIPEIAGKHHEKLDGSGYPNGITSDQIPVQSRMMTIVDIYDALTASDRPYKKALPVPRALDILSDEAKKGKLDSELLRIFIESAIYHRYSGESR